MNGPVVRRAARTTAILVLVASSFLGCARTTAPPGFLGTAKDVRRTAHGGWIQVDYRGPEPNAKGKFPTLKLDGELIAVELDTLHVLALEGFVSIPASNIKEAKLTAYDSGADVIAALTLVGTVSTITHGWILFGTAPVWVAAGSTATAYTTRIPRYVHPDKALVEISAFARFPQGLPPGLDRASLRSKTDPRWRRPNR